MRRLAIPMAALAVIVAACGDPLGGVGDLSRSVVHGEDGTSSTTEAATPSGPELALAPVTGVSWFNDGLEETTEDLGVERLIRAVWLRGDGVSPFVQASRFEIERALPGIEFPRLVPEGVNHVSSQLVFDPLTASLDVATAAAFGLWTDEPYAAPRSESQLAVLRVGLKTFEEGEDGDFFSFVVAEGREVSWTHGDHVYSLFCRTGVSEDACFAIAGSTAPLSQLSVAPTA